ncbi:hypothetical protein [Streptomyces sp. A1547]|uniref:hypothetical protein n=1 Tax=Streptomyces sp. A1547 TaxID=2563105 RepID=UPI00109E38E0|nr:hypothetical protein [Streptomyces sp. A1547]THA28463.1 hypothetical protein E6W17_40950 [Streptomyces sp. A1547]
MSKSEIRRLDNLIAVATRKLAGVQRRETWALPAGEQARMAGHVAVIIGKGTRLKSSPRAERGIDTIWNNAEDRLRAEIAAAQTAKAELIHQAAKAKTEKKSSGWW